MPVGSRSSASSEKRCSRRAGGRVIGSGRSEQPSRHGHGSVLCVDDGEYTIMANSVWKNIKSDGYFGREKSIEGKVGTAYGVRAT